MRYLESKEQSAEILRLALASMGAHEAPFHPLNYTLWYEHLSGVNAALSDVLTRMLSSHVRLVDEDVRRLYMNHVASRDTEALEHLRDRLRELLEETAYETATVGKEVATFGASLSHRGNQLREPMTVERLREIVAGLLDDTQRLQVRADEISGALSVRATEVAELSARLAQAQSEALLDPLTGLNNRRGLERAVAALDGRGHGIHGSSVLMLDIDHFKRVNDSHGHLLGDRVLRVVAQVVRSCIRGRDIAARIGGEEFVVVLPDTPGEGACRVAETIRRAVEAGRIRSADSKVVLGQVTLSVGVAVAEAKDSFESLLERADRAMYAAKNSGRNRISMAPLELTDASFSGAG